MLKKVAAHVKRHELFVACMIALALQIALLCVDYRAYAYALAWHWRHGNYAMIGDHRVRLPIWWWEETPENPDISLLVRACRAQAFPETRIAVRWAFPNSVQDTDEKELQYMRDLLSVVIPEDRSFMMRTSKSLLFLRTKPFPLYCLKYEYAMPGRVTDIDVDCNAAKVPYTFSYSGTPTREKETQSILSTLE